MGAYGPRSEIPSKPEGGTQARQPRITPRSAGGPGAPPERIWPSLPACAKTNGEGQTPGERPPPNHGAARKERVMARQKKSKAASGRRLRSQFWFDNPGDPGMTA